MPDWESCANRHLLAHILKGARTKSYYCDPVDTARGASSSPAQLSIEISRILKSWAHCWALDMAEWPSGPPTAQEQRAAWEYAMQKADEECRKAKSSCEFGLPEDLINELSQEIPR